MNATDTLAARFNRICECELLDKVGLQEQLDAQTGLAVSPQLFATLAVFVDPQQSRAMRDIVSVISSVVSLPRYQHHVLARAPEIARHDPRTSGVFLGFDFHLSAEGPRLIEINTNAGGAFLNLAALAHQRACCPAPGSSPDSSASVAIEAGIHAMFLDEWRKARGAQPLGSLVIVDENPATQFLFPEFLLAQRLFRARGIQVSICDPSELRVRGDTLYASGQPVDLVYNRLTDFYFEDPRHQCLREAWLRDLAVVTPHPRAHALWADKGNLVLLTDEDFLRPLGVPDTDVDVLRRGIPRTVPVQGAPERWWQERKQWFFKPRHGFGSRGTYRGDKLTRRVFAEVLAGDYIAQRFAPPGERAGGEGDGFKYDVRCYVHDALIQLMAARLFQGQTTNFRTPGGGFAPVYVVGTS